MKTTILGLVIVGITCFSYFSKADIQPEISTFLKTFPDKMSCDGVESNQITGIEKRLSQRVTIIISDKETDHPMIEVLAPSASRKPHFKIGNGYGARLEQFGQYSYLFHKSDNGLQVLYYLPVLKSADPVTFLNVLRIRDAGALISFYSDRVCTSTSNCIELSNCKADK